MKREKGEGRKGRYTREDGGMLTSLSRNHGQVMVALSETSAAEGQRLDEALRNDFFSGLDHTFTPDTDTH